MNTKSPARSSQGAMPSSSCCHSGVPTSGFLALITTPLAANRESSALLLTNVGSSVLNLIAGLPFAPAGGAVFFLKSPWIVFPVDTMSATLPARTCFSKFVNEISRRLGVFASCEETIRLMTSNTTSTSQMRRPRPIGPCGLAGFGSGAPSTRHGR